MSNVEDKVLQIVGQMFDLNPSDIEVSMAAGDIDGWDSLSHVTLMLMLSREFSIKISPTETESLQNIEELINFIKDKNN